jgi:23S rRNA pseudouridine1911/1915/1917 synthase
VRGRTARQHLVRCAPDVRAFILARGEWPACPAAAFELAVAAEAALLASLKQLRFRDGRSWQAAAAELGVAEQRLRGALRRDSLGIDIVRDEQPVDVIFEDDELLVLSKPPDLRAHPVHRFQGGSLLNRAAAHVGALAPVPAIVHRLDQDTSGVMLLVKHRAAAGGYAEQFARRSALKDYLAMCVGVPPAACFAVDAPIAPHPRHAPARMLAAADGKAATTRFQVEVYRPAGSDGRPPAALLRCTPLTGRTHQIRLHAAAAGLPIALDPFYGPSEETLRAAMCGAPPPDGMTRQALHAARLELARPSTGAPLRFEAPMPADMAALAEALGLAVDAPGALRGDEALAAALGAGEAQLCWPHTTLPVHYRDDPRALAEAAAAAADE